jgi:hypothetical protein
VAWLETSIRRASDERFRGTWVTFLSGLLHFCPSVFIYLVPFITPGLLLAGGTSPVKGKKDTGSVFEGKEKTIYSVRSRLFSLVVLWAEH